MTRFIIKHMMAELPFMATENIMMDAVKAGWRQTGTSRKNKRTFNDSWQES